MLKLLLILLLEIISSIIVVTSSAAWIIPKEIPFPLSASASALSSSARSRTCTHTWSSLSSMASRSTSVSELIDSSLFSSTSESSTTIISRPTKFQSNDRLWNRLLPPIWNSSARGVDETITFKIVPKSNFLKFRQMENAVGKLMQQCGITSNHPMYNIGVEQILECLKSYEFVHGLYLSESMNANRGGFKTRYRQEQDPTQFKIRLVSSRGPQGIKCPRWHVDHVSVRLLCALIGPGVCYLPSSNEGSIHRENVNSSDDVDTLRTNSSILLGIDNDESHQVYSGDIAILVGKSWETKSQGRVQAAIHKSPNIAPFVGRVFLTIDVIENEIIAF